MRIVSFQNELKFYFEVGWIFKKEKVAAPEIYIKEASLDNLINDIQRLEFKFQMLAPLKSKYGQVPDKKTRTIIWSISSRNYPILVKKSGLYWFIGVKFNAWRETSIIAEFYLWVKSNFAKC